MSDSNDMHTVKRDEPFDRLTHLSVEMTVPLETPENKDVRAIVFLSDEYRSGIQLHGYDDPAEAMAELFVHMKAIFQSMGKDLDFVGIPDSPEGLN
jgi:hypothetical protein